jgi:hypothetical protein
MWAFGDIKVAMQARPRRIKCVSGERNTGDLRDYRIITCSQRVGCFTLGRRKSHKREIGFLIMNGAI